MEYLSGKFDSFGLLFHDSQGLSVTTVCIASHFIHFPEFEDMGNKDGLGEGGGMYRISKRWNLAESNGTAIISCYNRFRNRLERDYWASIITRKKLLMCSSSHSFGK